MGGLLETLNKVRSRILSTLSNKPTYRVNVRRLTPELTSTVEHNDATRIDPQYLMRRRLTPEESEYETRRNNVIENLLTIPFNLESALNVLEGVGEGMQAITPEFLREPLAKVGTYISPLNYLAAISQGSIDPKVGEEVIAKWDPRLLLLGRVGEAVYGPKATKSIGNGVRSAVRLYMYKDLYPLGLLSNKPLIARGDYVSPEDLTSQTVERGFTRGNEPTPEVVRFAVEEPEHIPGPYLLENPVHNPALKAAALDYLEENPWMKNEINTRITPGVSEDWSYPYDVMVRHGLREPVTTTNKYTRQPVVEQPVSQQTFAPYPNRRFSWQPGFSENWDYMLSPTKLLRYNMSKGIAEPTVEPTVEPAVKPPRKSQKQRSKEYQLEKAEDKLQGVGKTRRRVFNNAHSMESGDMRHSNTGRPSLKQVRNALANKSKYFKSDLKELDKLELKLAKKGLTKKEIDSHPDIINFWRELIEKRGHFKQGGKLIKNKLL